MKVVSWNVNSVVARRERLLAWLHKHQPDVLCLQELKSVDDGFPRAEVEALGYHVALHGQRTYNGVAVLSRAPIDDVRKNLDDGDEETDARHHTADESLLVCGDFNIAPEDRDVYDPEALREDVLCHPLVREKWRALLAFGLVDTFRQHVPDAGKYSWWDYRMLGFPKGRGLRIDHLLASAPLAARCVGAAIDREERKGKQPSDHAPALAEFTSL